MQKRGRFSEVEMKLTGPSTWIAEYAVLQVEDGMSGYGIVQPYIGRVINRQTDEELYKDVFPNWSQAYAGVYNWYVAQVQGGA